MEISPISNSIGIKEAASIYGKHTPPQASHSIGNTMLDADRADIVYDLKKELLAAIDSGQWTKAEHIIKMLQKLA